MLVLYSHANPYADHRHLASRHFVLRPPTGPPVTLRVDQRPDAEISLHSNTGSVTWDAAGVLAGYLVAHPELVPPGARVLELGAGTGLGALGAAVASKGTAEVLATDLEECMELLRSNLEANAAKLREEAGWELRLRAEPLDWLQDAPPWEPFDLVIAADVQHIPSLHRPLLRTIAALSKADTGIVVCYKPRGLGEEGFLEIARADGWRTEVILWEQRETWMSEYVLFRMKRPRPGGV
ncbi:putative methyltransferase-domain-containing protein [Hyaloraphidium curvatum]|nr:putative methyltransferase-domain-containing protein [Hyaloraphidium curvatum]